MTKRAEKSKRINNNQKKKTRISAVARKEIKVDAKPGTS